MLLFFVKQSEDNHRHIACDVTVEGIDHMFRAQLRRLLRDNRGNVALMFAASLFPLSFLIGMGIDYTMASDRQAQLNGFADAAALAAVTPTMMAQADLVAKTAATSTFNAQAQQLTSDHLFADQSQCLGLDRRLAASALRPSPIRPDRRRSSRALLGTNQINLGGTSTATGGLAPNIDFYLMLDDLPSMAIAATTDGYQHARPANLELSWWIQQLRTSDVTNRIRHAKWHRSLYPRKKQQHHAANGPCHGRG